MPVEMKAAAAQDLLLLSVKDTLATSATVPVRWCLSRVTLDHLKSHGIVRPHLLLVIWDVATRHEDGRYLVPLEDMMTYIAFGSPGRKRINGTIVWDDGGEAKKLRHRFIVKGARDYQSELIDVDSGKLIPLSNAFASAQTGIAVDARFFASKPSGWLKAWVDFAVSKPYRNECQFRRWALASIFLTPLTALIVAAVFFLVFCIGFLGAAWFGLLLCKPGVNWRRVFDPREWDDELNEAWEDCRYTESIFARWYLWPVCPITILSTAVVLLILNQALDHPFLHGFGSFAVWIAGCIAALFLGSLLLRQGTTRSKKPRPRKTAAAPVGYYDHDLAPLVCRSLLVPDRRALPREKRTFALLLAEFKSRVCRPIAR